jgi:AraC-like DNA-binding protein
VPRSGATHQHVERMLNHIKHHYTQRLTLGTLAQTLGRQAAYLGRLFRDEIGVTVREYVTRARMMNGAVQVRSGVKIEAVALDLGYQSKKNFYRQFKRRFGMTPDAYRHVHHGAPVRIPVAAGPRDAGDGQRGGSETSTFAGVSTPPNTAPGRTRERPTRPTLLVEHTIMRTLLGSCFALLVTDDSGCYAGANNAALCITGYSVDELRGQPVERLFPYLSGADTRCRLQILLAASPSVPTNTVLHTKSAGPVRVHLTNAENVLAKCPRRPTAAGARAPFGTRSADGSSAAQRPASRHTIPQAR